MAPSTDSQRYDSKQVSASEKSSVDHGNTVDIESSDMAAIWRKIDTRVLPVIIIMLFFSFLDRNNISNARVAGLQQDLKLTNREFSVSLTVTYIPLILVMVPCNILFEKVGPNILLPTLTVLWGFTSMMQGFVTSLAGLIVCRVFLGIFLGGILPGMFLYLSCFYSRFHYQLRVSMFFAIVALAGAFSGLLAAAIMKMNHLGGRPGWAWIFILEGLVATLFGIASFWLLPRSFEHATFLNETEKAAMRKVFLQDKMISNDKFQWKDVWSAFSHPHVWLMSLAAFFGSSTESGLAYFEPSIVQSFHFSPTKTQLMSVPPFAVAFVLAFISGYLSDRYRLRSATCIALSGLAVIGFALFLGSENSSFRVRYGSLFMALPGTYCAAPALGAWTANNIAPFTTRAVALALMNVMASFGGILAIWLLGFLSPAPQYSSAAKTFVAFSVGEMVCCILCLFWCIRENRKKAALRSKGESDASEIGGLEGKRGDRSLDFVYTY